jgi:UDP-N-acetylmuramoyl-L-alanyl-D-glutamate--2,6-diaminopimelate ligase
MQLSDLARSTPGAETARPSDGIIDVRGISHDSREVKPGDLFVCLVGEKSDGHRFAADAVARGAAALAIQADHADEISRNVPRITVPDTRRALPALSAALFGHPSRAMKVVGITGTNGKTTTTFLTAAILQRAGLKTGTIGTLGAYLGDEKLPSEHTTPEADQLQALLAEMRSRGAEAVVMEASSHALAQYRTDSIDFDAAAFTNLTQDHLDYHGDMESYYRSKLRLFTDYPAESGKLFAASINVDDSYGRRLATESKGRVLTYAIDGPADIRAESVETGPGSVSFRAATPSGGFDVRLNIGGAFQAYNALAAIGVAVGLGMTPDVIAAGLASLTAVPGRFESVPTGRGFHVIVDYAHTPDGLENLVASARRLKPARILLVFGCGGNRDRTKRPIMGRTAATKAEVAIVTSDNPRNEDPNLIIEEVLAGMKDATADVIVEPDSRAAIATAIAQARDGDIILIAGKGHEDYQLVGDNVLSFDDRLVAREILGMTEAVGAA